MGEKEDRLAVDGGHLPLLTRRRGAVVPTQVLFRQFTAGGTGIIED
jgi:hypothetical protein